MALTYDSRGNPILNYGVQDGSVAWLAQVLSWWGYQPSMSDVYDWTTAEAVASLQRRYNLAPTGEVNEQTWTLIDQLQRGIDPRAVADDTPAPNPGGDFNARPGGMPAPSTPGSPQPSNPDLNRDALARLGQLLSRYGLEGMTDWVRSKLLAGASESEIQLELYDQPAFKARFPVIEARRQAGLTPVDVGDVLEFEQRGRELLRQAGITNPAFTSNEYLQGLMGRDVSVAELQGRLNDGLLRVTVAPPEVRAAFGEFFGPNSDAAMASLFLDPDVALPELEKMAMTAYAGGIGDRFGFDIAQGIAREIADTGVSQAGIWQGYAQLDQMNPLFKETIGENRDLTAEGEGVAAVFNTQPGAASTLERRRLSRVNQLQGAGGAAATEAGVIGLGVADS